MFSNAKKVAVASTLALAFVGSAHAQEQIGSVDTEWKMVGPNHKLITEVYDDPKVEGVSCYLTSPRKGGIKGAVGLAEEASDASIACRQVSDKIRFTAPIGQQEEVFNKSRSLLFKELHVMRYWDAKRLTLVYVTYTDTVINGSPKNSTTAVPLPTGTTPPKLIAK